ncbi:hypothetical protein [Bacillus sp. T3]|uniref:hypothetical protein n=1 Tax=Bacillus sp. T3 TaxID=467262 RepID=UPI002981437D|nr:hypothetical protein [Bacillus sp. T3]
MNKKIFYLMHVDWSWIKQRPHFLAENLSKVFNILVFHLYSRNRKVMTSNPSDINKLPIITFPLKRIKIFNILSIASQKIIFYFYLKQKKPEIIWITYPALYDYLPKKELKNYKVIYDCMDDVQGFNNIPRIKKELEISEIQLLKDADHVFVSSENLRDKIVQRGCNRDKTTLVRNGYDGKIIDPIEQNNSSEIFKIAYIGTISEWVNFDMIVESTKSVDNIEYHFYGPIDCEVPTNSKIIFHGPVKHEDLYKTIQDCSCLIMPFKVNELILSVDPVKLYEYINFNKNIITVYYPEIERFNDFVYFYHNSEEYFELLRQLKENNQIKYDRIQRYDFLKENSWEKRSEVVIDIINKKFF